MQARETPHGFLLHAREFLAAGELVLNHAPGVSLPAYFLLARSIELSFKGFLLAGGMTPQTLRVKPFGHNLGALLDEAAQRRLEDYVPLEEVETAAVKLLSHEYSGTRLGYRVSHATYCLPNIEFTEQVARKLVFGLGPFCGEARETLESHEVSQ